MKQQKDNNPAKSYKPASSAYIRLTPAEKREDINWQSKYYRDKGEEFFSSASYEAPSAPKEVECTKAQGLAVIEAAKRVRHNAPRNTYKVTKYVMIGGVPHKLVDGNLVALTKKEA
jgi:hypothetical protein